MSANIGYTPTTHYFKRPSKQPVGQPACTGRRNPSRSRDIANCFGQSVCEWRRTAGWMAVMFDDWDGRSGVGKRTGLLFGYGVGGSKICWCLYVLIDGLPARRPADPMASLWAFPARQVTTT